jgi:hypothetical protein
MYRSDDFLGSESQLFQVPDEGPGRYHRLAEAIRRGCEVWPKKVKRYYSSGKDGACALGAAMFGAGKKLPRRDVYDAIVRVFPELNDVVDIDHSPVRSLSVGWKVVRLNEDTEYSREAIAGWLCRLGGCKHQVTEPEIKPGGAGGSVRDWLMKMAACVPVSYGT